MLVKNLIKSLQRCNPESIVLINKVDDFGFLRNVPIRDIKSTDTGRKESNTKVIGDKSVTFNMNGGDEKVVVIK